MSKDLKTNYFSKNEKEKSRRMIFELCRIKYEIGRANKWTKSSIIVIYIGTNTHSIKAGIIFNSQTMNGTHRVGTLCGSTDYSRKTYPMN